MPRDPEAIKNIEESLRHAALLEQSIKEAEQKLASDKANYHELTHSVLPSQFNSAGIRDTLTLAGEGNFPTYDCTLKPYFKAVIPAKWDDARRAEALEELESHGAGDLAKRVVIVRFARSEESECSSLCKRLDDMGYSYSVSFELPWQTLTAWLRESVDRGVMPDLEKIGGQVGQVVVLKIKED